MDYKFEFDAFISYKRAGGSVWAELIRAILEHKYHLKVFLDVQTMHGGDWSEQLDNAIRKSRNIIMVLHKDLGENVKSENDVFIQEITLANKYQKPIIPFYTLDCDINEITNNESIPQIIKEVILKQHGIVKYNHVNTETTYDQLRKQLDVKIELDICSQNDSCNMRYQIGNEIPAPSVKIEKNSNIAIDLNREFKGEIHITLYTETTPSMILEYLVCIGESGENICLSPNYNEVYYLQPNQEIYRQFPVDWALCKRRIEENAMMIPSFNPMQAALNTTSPLF